MKSADDLNRTFCKKGEVCFRQLPDDIVIAEINNSLATASVSLYGGHVVSWQPKTQTKPVLWVSELVKFQKGKAIRGGVPICWPWFGAHPANASLPSHGYARITPWELTSVQTLSNGATELNLILGKTDLSQLHWQAEVHLELKITVGDTLVIALTTVNKSEHEVTFTEGLHTYFQISDIGNIRVLGLEGGDYIDLVNQNEQRTQQDAIAFDGELGRIFLNNQATCVIEDPALNRRIRIEKTGSNSTAVWNPGLDVASKIDDLGAAGWRNMVCVESANADGNPVTLRSQGLHTIVATYSAAPIRSSAESKVDP
jgi:D-hexose-6-phosphate mutarotase